MLLPHKNILLKKRAYIYSFASNTKTHSLRAKQPEQLEISQKLDKSCYLPMITIRRRFRSLVSVSSEDMFSEGNEDASGVFPFRLLYMYVQYDFGGNYYRLCFCEVF